MMDMLQHAYMSAVTCKEAASPHQIESLFLIVWPVDGQVAHVDVGLFIFHDGNLGQIF